MFVQRALEEDGETYPADDVAWQACLFAHMHVLDAAVLVARTALEVVGCADASRQPSGNLESFSLTLGGAESARTGGSSGSLTASTKSARSGSGSLSTSTKSARSGGELSLGSETKGLRAGSSTQANTQGGNGSLNMGPSTSSLSKGAELAPSPSMAPGTLSGPRDATTWVANPSYRPAVPGSASEVAGSSPGTQVPASRLTAASRLTLQIPDSK